MRREKKKKKQKTIQWHVVQRVNNDEIQMISHHTRLLSKVDLRDSFYQYNDSIDLYLNYNPNRVEVVLIVYY